VLKVHFKIRFFYFVGIFFREFRDFTRELVELQGFSFYFVFVVVVVFLVRIVISLYSNPSGIDIVVNPSLIASRSPS
jgi:hypothetical protein